MKPLILSGRPLRAGDVIDVALHHRPVRIGPQARRRMLQSRRIVEQVVEDEKIVYGVSTGVGRLADQLIPHEDLRQLQANLVRSHACGIGLPLSPPQTRAIILLRAHVFTLGYSGVRPLLVDTLLQLLNRSVTPQLPSRGSVGASGDLIPLAHLALVLIGEGEAVFQEKLLSGKDALRRAGISPLRLEAKEGISLVNGTQASLAVGLLAMQRAESLLLTADLAGAMSLEALKGSTVPFDPAMHRLRPHPGQGKVAGRLRRLLSGSEIRASHIACSRVQDPYSLRCIPQVHGSVDDALMFIKGVLQTEINSVTDNPLVFVEKGKILSGGNFHGHPVALALDLLAIAVSHLGLMAERRIAQLVHPDFIDLPPFLTTHPGLHSGFMMPQVAAAALASECKILSHPASVDTIPTSANQEDYVSMAMGAALKMTSILDNVEGILAIELLAAGQGVEFHRPLKPGRGVARALARLRSVSPRVEADRSLQREISVVQQMIGSGEFARIALA